MIKRMNLNSTAITKAEYDTTKRELILTFKGGVDYTYPGIDVQYYDGLVSAPSAGRYYNQVIKPLMRR